MLVPVGNKVGLTCVSLGVIRAIEQKGTAVTFFKPIDKFTGNHPKGSTNNILKTQKNIKQLPSLSLDYAETMISSNSMDNLLEEVLESFNTIKNKSAINIIEGIDNENNSSLSQKINYQISKTLNAEIVFVTSQYETNEDKILNQLDVIQSSFGGKLNSAIKGFIINKYGQPDLDNTSSSIFLNDNSNETIHEKEKFINAKLPCIATIPWNPKLFALRPIDLAQQLEAEILIPGEIYDRRIRKIVFCARSISNMIDTFSADSLLVIPSDRADVLVSASLAVMNGIKIGAILLTGNYEIPKSVLQLCEQAFNSGLTLLKINSNTWETSLRLQHIKFELPSNDKVRIELVQEYISSKINPKWLESLNKNIDSINKLSPPAFRYKLTELARLANKKIILPEGDEPRTIAAAAICAEKNIAQCVLLGNKENIKRIANQQGINLHKQIKIIEPQSVAENYVKRLVELRKAKGITEVVAKEQLKDTVVLGTMMLEAGEVDGLVSGAIHTTANTIRPPLQIIKTAPGSSIVSSIFFMLLPDQVLVYGDCAINPDPTAEQLAEIAIQSADSAKSFGIDPKVAMISYSTGTSGKGADVDKVRLATEIAKNKRPDLLIDGPLQYDAAIMENVAASKAPNSPVAGKATVFIFPDLNTGNTTYKAVQRSAELVSIGPMLQGMRKPVNDLSRGALVDDIVYTIALTAIQAT